MNWNLLWLTLAIVGIVVFILHAIRTENKLNRILEHDDEILTQVKQINNRVQRT